MKFPTHQWLKIVEYREFFDIPRYFLASDGRSYWVLDGSFDDAKDDYSDEFAVRFAGTSESEAIELFAQLATNPAPSSDALMAIATKHFRFDKTNRAECFADLGAVS